MIKIKISIEIPQLWKQDVFSKESWNDVNFIVGPNGTGKSLFAENLSVKLRENNLQVQFLNAERLAGLERQNYSPFAHTNINRGFDIGDIDNYIVYGERYGLSASAFVILKKKLDVKIKIEAFLSDFFNKTIRLVEEGGYLKPKIQNISGGTEYLLTEHECHGLKELITLLTFLYDGSKNCFIIDEPELHLHPQFQSFFLSEVRKIAGNPFENKSKKMFVIVTHSPYLLDFQKIEDLQGTIVCHFDRTPTYITELEEQDKRLLKKFLPRFNTHHKQFFFSPNPVFVEGYTDQQLITLILDKLQKNPSASGSCVIDVGGKDELASFFNICNKLTLKSPIIADLDAIFTGKLREVVCADERSKRYIQDQGIGTDISKEIGEVETMLSKISDELEKVNHKDEDLKHLVKKTKEFSSEKTHKKRVATLLGIQKHKEKIEGMINDESRNALNLIQGRLGQITKAFKKCGVTILPGEIEHFYTQSEIDYLNITNTEKIFHKERDYLLDCQNIEEIKQKYSELINLIEECVPSVKIDIIKHIKFTLIEWIQKIQRLISKGEIANIDDLKSNGAVEYDLYSQLLNVIELKVQNDKKFKCKIKLNSSLTGDEKEIEFDECTIPHNFEL